MRKYLLLLALPAMVACGTKGPKEATVAGKYVNTADSTILVMSKGITDTLYIGSNGEFIFKTTISEPQLYKFVNSRMQTLVYMNPGDSSYFELDVKEPMNGPKFMGDQQLVNSNLYKGNATVKEILKNYQELYSLTTDKFNQKLDSIQGILNSNIDSIKGEAKLIVEMEKMRAKYTIMSIKNNYPRYFAYLNDKEFNADSADFSFLNELDVNNANHLMFDDYANLLNTYIELKLSKLPNYKEISEKPATERLPIVFAAVDSFVTNPTVRDYVKMNLMEDDLSFGDFYLLNDVIQNYLAKCQTPEYANIVKGKFDKKMLLAPGAVAPVFKYTDINGKEYSLEDFKGKLVYIDFWATWCGPCRYELPFLQALEKDYHGKKVVFVSISLDDNKTAWQKMVKEQSMKGVQLYGEGAWKSFVATNYQIRGIPTFFLIDANGNILKPNAPRPSSDEIRPLLDENLAKL
ncbi:MAG TPA: TlpA disulfide reductase family protein [Tenuifilaceae bacterium]|nr:TlpA disulfide reductase family protein [Tenuifilaceae bacterium]HOZ13193.1 TlpA disulfide reductase family protein [Tenuifilaceae bacterium]HPI44333.1 TlpA disulfide reductase family protein [Tenuifilaceae bacterium]HPN21517.1 TlpA disulfide reductase family protein [Tenuifilaceae bacterium]